MQSFLPDINCWFKEGERKKGRKMSAVAMHAKMMQLYRNGFDISGSHYFQNVIASMMVKKREEKTSPSSSTGAGDGVRRYNRSTDENVCAEWQRSSSKR